MLCYIMLTCSFYIYIYIYMYIYMFPCWCFIMFKCFICAVILYNYAQCMTPARDPKQRLGFALLETSFGEREMDIWGSFRKHVVEHFGNLLGAGKPDGARPNLEESRAIFIDKNRCLGSRPPFSSRRNAHEGHEVLCFINKNGW